jgi:hypothetical protein
MTYIPTQKDKIYGMLLMLTFDEHFSIEEKVKPENREQFIQIVKEFINCDFGKAYNFIIEFSSDYKTLRKQLTKRK